MFAARRWSPFIAACLLVWAAACAKGAKSIEDAPPDGSGGATGGGGTGGSGGTGSGSICGDGVITGLEKCDRQNLNGETCMGLGFGGGQLFCDPMTCTYDSSMCLRMPTGMGGNSGSNGT